MRWPVDIPRVTPHGKWGYVRHDRSEGACGAKGIYPCTHTGLDLAGPEGTEVYAPERSRVVAVGVGFLPPFTGYEPAAILLKGLDTGAFHLFGHLLASSIPSPTVPGSLWDRMTTPLYKSADQGRTFAEGDQIGEMSAANHTHWETRVGAWGARNNPALWVKRYVSPSLDLRAWSVGGDGGGGDLLLLLALAWAASEL